MQEEILKKHLIKPEEENKGETLPPDPEAEKQNEDGEGTSQAELNSNPVPTQEQLEEANMATADEEGHESNETTLTPNPENPDPAQSEDFADSVDGEIRENTLTPEQQSVEKMLSQSQVDELIGRTRVETRDKTRNDTLNEMYARYGVNDEAGLDDAMGRSQKYDLLREDYDSLANELKEIKIKLAMYDSGIDPERYEDARLILSGKQMDITPENIQAELSTHPEWKKTLPSAPQANEEVQQVFKKAEPIMPESRISVLGNDKPEIEQSGNSERESALKMFH